VGKDLQHRKIRYSTEATEALADDTPFALLLGVVGSEASTDSFAVTDNIIRPEMLQVLGLFHCIALKRESPGRYRRAHACATLV
jgi:hypothetical protein